VKTGIQAAFPSDGYPPETAGMTELGGHFRHCLSGIQAAFPSDGYPPETAGMTELGRHSRHCLSGIQVAFPSDGYPPETAGMTAKKCPAPLRLPILAIWWRLFGVTVAGKNTLHLPCHPLPKPLLKFGHFLNSERFA
jgi:hypothetical protein